MTASHLGRGDIVDWHTLYFGHVSPTEVHDPTWQALRASLIGTTLETKYNELQSYYSRERVKVAPNSQEARYLEVRITNYVTALSRGGLLKPSDYRD